MKIMPFKRTLFHILGCVNYYNYKIFYSWCIYIKLVKLIHTNYLLCYKRQNITMKHKNKKEVINNFSI